MVDQRLATLGTDYIDLFFIHGLGDDNYGGIDKSVELVKSQEFHQVAERSRSRQGEVHRLLAPSPQRTQIIQAAAEGGVIDAIMLQYRPWLEKDSALNKAIDAAGTRGSV